VDLLDHTVPVPLHATTVPDPANERYMEHMLEMDSAHLSQYGRAIPPRA